LDPEHKKHESQHGFQGNCRGLLYLFSDSVVWSHSPMIPFLLFKLKVGRCPQGILSIYMLELEEWWELILSFTFFPLPKEILAYINIYMALSGYFSLFLLDFSL
jgi:hypothetical protein